MTEPTPVASGLVPSLVAISTRRWCWGFLGGGPAADDEVLELLTQASARAEVMT